MPDPHQLTHHGGKPDWIERVALINTHHMELFVYFIRQLKVTPDGDGTLLDRCMVVYGSGIADGDRHSHENLPVLLVGQGGGTLSPGRHIIYPDDTPMTNLYLTLLDRLGVREDTPWRQHREDRAAREPLRRVSSEPVPTLHS